MKYHIDTIPVWDAVHLNSECPLCALRRRTERLLVQRSLGASVMSPDTRLKVNQKGFCASHQAMLYAYPGGNRLGHGLMMLSHLQTQRPRLNNAILCGKPGGREGGTLASRLFGKAQASGSEQSTIIREVSAACLLCEELEQQSERQAASLVHLWKTDPHFRESFSQSKGLCVPHSDSVSRMANEFLSGTQLEEFLTVLQSLLNGSLARLEEELAWFTQKFDYRNAQEPWGNSRDALERTVNKLQGWCLGSEPMQDETT